MRILLVDDDPVISDLLSSSLERQGFADITLASSAERAIDLVDSVDVPFDCFLLDIMLGNMDGIELCERLRRYPDLRAAPIIMITSSKDSICMDRAFDAGATDFLRKPLDQTEVAGRIRTAMLLVETIKKEQRGRYALQTLMSHAGELDLGDVSKRLCFPDVAGMLDYFQLENRLLRMREGQYQLGLFRIQMDDFNDLVRGGDQVGILNLIYKISTKIGTAVPGRRLWFAYLGVGRFVCCVIGRTSTLSPPFQAELQRAACNALASLAHENDMDLKVSVASLADTGILSRKSALTLMRKEFNATVTPPASMLPEINLIEDRIFAQIDKARSVGSHGRG